MSDRTPSVMLCYDIFTSMPYVLDVNLAPGGMRNKTKQG